MKNKATSKSTKKSNKRKEILARAYIVFGLVFVFAMWILISAAKLQLGLDKEFKQMLNNKNLRTSEMVAQRGNIYADNEKLLATTLNKYTLIMDPNANGLTTDLFNKNIDSLSLLLNKYVGLHTKDVWKSMLTSYRTSGSRYKIIAKDLDYGIIKFMRKWPVIRQGRYKGFYFNEYGERLYFMGDMARRAVGYSKGETYVGLEGAFDSLLRGVNGEQIEQRLPGGVWRSIKTANYKQPRQGYDILTTLDVEMQDVAQYALNKAMLNNNATQGCALIMEVKTGAIKAIANLTIGKDGKYYETKNLAVDDYSEPGSTVKLISCMALINDGFVKSTDTVNINWGRLAFFDRTMEDATPPKKTLYTFKECFQLSSNVGISKLVQKHYGKNPNNFIEYFKKLGLHQPPNFDIKGANYPLVNSPKNSNWSSTTLPWLSIGYECLLSPLQILNVYNTIANNGVMMRPYMVKEIRHKGQTLNKIESQVIANNFLEPATIIELKKMMESVVESGTATNVKSANYLIAGKTGTAQVANGNKGYKKGVYKSSFVGYMPADNPKYSIIVVINEPKKGVFYGASVAGPVFKEISDYIYSITNDIQKTNIPNTVGSLPTILNGKASKTTKVLKNLGINYHSVKDTMEFTKTSIQPYGIKLEPFNDLTKNTANTIGMGLIDAIAILEKQGYQVKYTGLGKVYQQSISPTTQIKKGLTIILNLKMP